MERDNQKQGKKRNHHYIQKYFLKGFTILNKKSHLWIYKFNSPYDPGKKSTNNPQCRTIKKVAMIRDFYAFETTKGSIDYESIEKELESIEDLSNKIIRKIREKKFLTNNEKSTFSSYIFNMHRRNPKREVELKPDFKKIKESITKLGNNIDIPNFPEILEKELEEISWDDAVRMGFTKKSILVESKLKIPSIMSSMIWQFFVAPDNCDFLLGDDPVNISKMNKSIAEISIPISSKIALVLSWYENNQLFVNATAEQVNEINLRSIQQANKEVYSSELTESTFNKMKIKRDGYYLIYDPSNNIVSKNFYYWEEEIFSKNPKL